MAHNIARVLGRGSRVLVQDLGPNGSRIVGLGSLIVVRGPGTIPDKSVRVPQISGQKPMQINDLRLFPARAHLLPLGGCSHVSLEYLREILNEL